MIFLVLFHFFSLLTNPLFKAHATVKSNAPATLPRQYTHTQTLYQSHVNAAGCQRCLPFHWLTADIRIPAVPPPRPALPPLPRTVKLRSTCSRTNEDGGPTQAALWFVRRGGRVREKFGSPIQLWELRGWTELSEEAPVWRRQEWEHEPERQNGRRLLLVMFCSLWRVFALSHGMRRSIPMDLDKRCHGIMHWKARGCNKKVLES